MRGAGSLGAAPRSDRVRAALRQLVAVMLVFMLASAAAAHDPSAYGGLYRSRSLGESWLNADVGLFLNAVLSVAVDPLDPAHLLMGTDLGVLRSHDGGRSWATEASEMIVGAVFAIAFAPAGGSALVAAPGGIFRFAARKWTRSDAPVEATPARAIHFMPGEDRVVLLGRSRLFESRDGGRSFTRMADSLASTARISACVIADGGAASRRFVAIIDDRLMASDDDGRSWRRLASEFGGPIDALALDPASPTRLWIGGANHVHRSDDLGASWRVVGERLPQLGNVRGIAADPAAMRLTVTSNRGLFSSEDGGASWVQREGTLPVHLESGPLYRDASDAATLYAVFALKPYPELWRKAIEDGDRLAPKDRLRQLGGLAVGAILLVTLAIRFHRRFGASVAKQPIAKQPAA